MLTFYSCQTMDVGRHVLFLSAMVNLCVCLDVNYRTARGVQPLAEGLNTNRRDKSRDSTHGEQLVGVQELVTTMTFQDGHLLTNSERPQNNSSHDRPRSLSPLMRYFLTKFMYKKHMEKLQSRLNVVTDVKGQFQGGEVVGESPGNISADSRLGQSVNPPTQSLELLPTLSQSGNGSLLPVLLVLGSRHHDNASGGRAVQLRNEKVKVSDLIKALRNVDNLINRIRSSPPPEIPRRVIDQKLLMLERIYSEISSTLTTISNRTREALHSMASSLENWDKLFKRPAVGPGNFKNAMQQLVTTVSHTGRSSGGSAQSNFQGIVEKLKSKLGLKQASRQISNFMRSLSLSFGNSSAGSLLSQVRKTSSFISWVTSGFRRFDMEEMFASLRNMAATIKKMFQNVLS